ncbi:methyltransferase domain-containing protein [Halioxenophilus aromaticivorans]|uniref:Arsenite methyltransferase n=1 Tax=Halioxenophilus aromaticivorans TaxID=1306992 RepID=A0AAV3U985_9ALTE
MYDVVSDYYGKQLQSSGDLKTDACCDFSTVPQWLKPLLSKIHPEVTARYYGCGLVCPEQLSGCRVLDLGCGTGRDVFALAQMVGDNGAVVGVDMTTEQLRVAEDYQLWHAEQFGFNNVSFIPGKIEQLLSLGLESGSFDIIVSNCVINLSPDKQAVLEGVKQLLKPGGEFYFSDVYCDRRLPTAIRQDPILYGECLGGALYWQDFIDLAKAAGFGDPRLVADRPLAITDDAVMAKVGTAKFFSATYRLFNIDELETACEDYGQAVIYRGGIEHHAQAFSLDKHHSIEAGRVFPVCGNTWRMLQSSRFAPHFEFIGDFTRHYGIFNGCGTDIPFTNENTIGESAPCC